MKKTFLRVVSVLVIGGSIMILASQCSQDTSPPSLSKSDQETSTPSMSVGEATILDAFANEVSDQWVEAGGTVDRILSDDNRGSRHQRFILRLSTGHTLLVSHNIDLADRLPGLKTGDWVEFRGEYEWNERGGVVHWTHHDPDGDIKGGWLEYEGRRYR